MRSFLSVFVVVLLVLAGSAGAAAQSREIRVVNVSNAAPGQTVSIPIEIVAQGNEAAVGFTLTFNPAVLSAPSVTVGSGATGATLFVNANSAASGLLGVTLATPIGQSIAAGVRQLVVVNFSVAANAAAGMTPIGFGDQLARREVSDANANVLTATFVGGTVAVAQSNPVPAITAINPASIIAGANPFTLTVTGINFQSNSVVRWNGANRVTAFVSATQLTAQVPATDVAVAGSAAITVQNPSPGGGVSNELALQINNPVPSIASLDPGAALVGSAALTLTVNGESFVEGATVRWKGETRATTRVSSTKLTVMIPAGDLSAAGAAAITVTNPSPGGGASNTVNFTVLAIPAAQVALSPASPTTNDDITIALSGSWPNGCVPQNPQLSLAGNELRISTSNTGQFCTQAITNWNLSAPQAKLPAGNYTIRATHRDALDNQYAIGQASFTVTNLAPSTAGLNPNTAVAGGPAFTLTVTGSNFNSGSIVRWNDADRPTTFVSETQLRASIPAADIATQGAANVKVFTPAPGGGTTNALSFVISGSLASVSAASFAQGEVAADSILAAFGNNLATRVEIASTTPLPTELAGTRLNVKDSLGVERFAAIFFVAPGQINYQMPPGTAAGAAMISVTSGDAKLSIGAARIAIVAPGLFSANATGRGAAAATALRVKANGEQTFELIARFDPGENRFVPIPIDLGLDTDQVFLVLSGTGLRFRSALTAVSCKLGGTDAEVLYAGLTPGLVGLDQANVRIPRSLAGRGEIDVVLIVDGKAANTVRVSIK